MAAGATPETECSKLLPVNGARARLRRGSVRKMAGRFSLMVSTTRSPYRISRRLLTHSIARAMYMYAAAIPEELSFGKGDVLAVLRHQDDGWWEAEVCGKSGQAGLVPSNYLKAC